MFFFSGAQLCPGEVQGQTVQAAPGKKSTFSFCVIARPNISNFLIFNNTAVYKNGDPNFNWNYTQSSFLSSFIVTVTIDNVTSLSYGKLTIGIFTSQSKENQLNYTVILEREGNCHEQCHCKKKDYYISKFQYFVKDDTNKR